jgi:hypothetical protein
MPPLSRTNVPLLGILLLLHLQLNVSVEVPLGLEQVFYTTLQSTTCNVLHDVAKVEAQFFGLDKIDGLDATFGVMGWVINYVHQNSL